MQKSWIIAGLIAVGGVAWILSGTLSGQEAPPETVAPVPAMQRPVPPVRVAEIRAEPRASTLILQGQTQANRTVQLHAEATGRVEEVLVERGARVSRGDPLVRLEAGAREAQLEEARALLAQREIEHNAAVSLSQQGYSARTQAAAARANLDMARRALRDAELELERITIRAPIDGVVDERPVEVGDFVDRGHVATLVDLSTIRVRGSLSERHLGKVELGALATIRTLQGVEAEGMVSFIGAAADPHTRTFPVEVEIDNPGQRIIANLTAELRLPVDLVPAHEISPALLTLADDGTVGVKSVDGSDRVVFHPVELLGDSGSGVWLGGLPETLRLIIAGQEFVTPGQRVRPVTVEEIQAETDLLAVQVPQ